MSGDGDEDIEAMLAEAEAADARLNAPRTVEQEAAAIAAVEDAAAEFGQSAKAHGAEDD